MKRGCLSFLSMLFISYFLTQTFSATCESSQEPSKQTTITSEQLSKLKNLANLAKLKGLKERVTTEGGKISCSDCDDCYLCQNCTPDGLCNTLCATVCNQSNPPSYCSYCSHCTNCSHCSNCQTGGACEFPCFKYPSYCPGSPDLNPLPNTPCYDCKSGKSSTCFQVPPSPPTK